MNWVGGSRSRLMLKDDMKRQREFFEKKKLQRRLQHLGLPVQDASTGMRTGGSMDLVTLFIVNQIAAKKENKDPPKVSVLSGGSRAVSKHTRREPLLLPMSPCSPSQLHLVESQAPEHRLTRRRKHVSKLSPVLESAFSDISASDYAPRAAETLSPWAEAATYRSPAWGGRDPFQAFSQPRDMMNMMNPRSRPCPSDLIQLETPSAAQVLFGSPSPLETERDVNPVVSAILRDPLDHDVPVLDFSLNHHLYQDQEPFDEDVFRGFSSGGFMSQEDESEKIHLTDLFQPLKPQMVPETMCRELSSSANTSFFCPGNSSGLYSPQCFTSDSSEDEEERCAQASLKSSSSPESNLRSPGRSLESLEHLCPFPPLKRRLKIREPTTDNNHQSTTRSTPESTPEFLRSAAQRRCLECLNKRIRTREAGTQTENTSRDTAVQCSLTPVQSAQRSSTRGQTEHTNDRQRPAWILSPGKPAEEWGAEEYWSRMMLGEKSHGGEHVHFCSSSSSNCQKWTGHLKNNAVSDLEITYKGQRSGERLRRTPADEVKGAKGNAEEAQTLEGVANILLLLKQGRHEAP